MHRNPFWAMALCAALASPARGSDDGNGGVTGGVDGAQDGAVLVDRPAGAETATADMAATNTVQFCVHIHDEQEVYVVNNVACVPFTWTAAKPGGGDPP